MHIRTVALFLCCLMLAGQKITVPLDESDKEGDLELLFVTALGDPVSGEPTVTVENLADGKRAAHYRWHLEALYSFPVTGLTELAAFSTGRPGALR